MVGWLHSQELMDGGQETYQPTIVQHSSSTLDLQSLVGIVSLLVIAFLLMLVEGMSLGGR